MNKNNITLVMALVLAVLLLVPLGNLALYVLFGIDVAAVVVLGGAAVIGKVKKTKLQSVQFVPGFLLVWSIFNIALAVAFSRNIITTEAFENQNKISCLFGKNTSTPNIIISSVIFLCHTISGLILGKAGNNRLKEQWKAVKNEGNKEKLEFYGKLEGSFCFLKGAFIFILLITAVIFFGSTLAGSLMYGKPILECLKENILLATGTSLLFQALNILGTFFVACCFV